MFCQVQYDRKHHRIQLLTLLRLGNKRMSSMIVFEDFENQVDRRNFPTIEFNKKYIFLQ